MDMDRFIGRLLDNRYEILEVIGTGGMAVVYKARCHRLNRLVAIKILRDDYSQDEEFRRRFHAESQAVAMLSHPNIVSVYDVSTSDDADYIVMELIDGITLKQYMEKKGVLNWKETLHFAIQIGKALDHAHSRGIIHRDIKPHNVMVLKNGSVKVADFGIARVMSKSNTLTKEALGSVHYISPEQAKGGRVDNRSDIYSLGVVMYEMMTGRPPYDGESPVSVAIQHINGKAAMPSSLNPNMPGGLEQIIMKAMAQGPANRYATATAMLADMDEFRKDPTILFDYNNPNTDMDAAAKLSSIPRSERETVVLPKTTAERVAAKTEPERRKAPPVSDRKPDRSRPARKRREEVIVEDEDRGGKLAAVAVIICALVAIVAIGIFVAAFMNGSQGEIVRVPDLLGKTAEEWAQFTDVSIRIGEKNYNDIYEKGQVYDQNPKANTQIAKGGTVTVYVSLGPAPQVKVMENLINMEEAAAKSFLIDTQGIKESQIKVTYENNSAPAGLVFRTDPMEGEELNGEMLIEIWVSSGPETQMGKVPNVKGFGVETATSILKGNGFNNIEYVPVESTMDKDRVVSQSIAPQTEVDVTTLIILEISLGPKDKPTDPTDPTDPTFPEDDPDLVYKIVTIELPGEMEEDYVLTIWLDEELVEERQIPAGTVSTEVELKGKGVMEFEARIDDGDPWPVEVDFDE